LKMPCKCQVLHIQVFIKKVTDKLVSIVHLALFSKISIS